MEYPRFTRALGLIALIFLLNGCMWPETHMKRYFNGMTPEVRLARLQHFNNWRVQGVFTVRCVDCVDHRPIPITQFSWKNIDKRQFNVRIESPRNDYDAMIMVAYRDVTVWRDFKYPFHIKDPAAYMLQELGWCVPMRSMPFWLRGIPAPAPFYAHYNKFGLIDLLVQQGWTIRYKSFTDVDGYSLPRSMTMVGQGVFISIVMNNWDTLLLNRSVEPL